MAIRGQPFQLLWDSDDASETGQRPIGPGPRDIDLGFIRDITERPDNGNTKPPAPPTLKSSGTAFPPHRKRAKPSAFNQQRSSGAGISNGSTGPIPTRSSRDELPPAVRGDDEPNASSANGRQDGSAQSEREKIDQENRQRLAEMSPEEIERERQEALSGLSSSLIERLLKRANIDQGRTDTLQEVPPNQSGDSAWPGDEQASARPRPKSKRVTFHTPEEEARNQPPEKDTTQQAKVEAQKQLPDEGHTQLPEKDQAENSDEPHTQQSTSLPPHDHDPDPDRPPTYLPDDLHPATSILPFHPPPNIHFPAPPFTPLDPSSPTFLTILRKTYFPSLPSTPSSLSWLAPLPSENPSSPPASSYSPALTSLPPSSLRFDFRGRLLPPRLAAQIPVTAGLHHHGDAPEAAGYTIRELAHLSRSTVPSQRCVAMQTLGRVLYRLGRGDFGRDDGGDGEGGGFGDGGDADGNWGAGEGEGEEGGGRELYLGLWKCIEEGRVLETLMEEAGRGEGKGNRSVWVTATEAVWLWRRGGGKRVRAG
ncbi:hypothetical protein MMC30_003752 [Trapelia coarctata]|nr:hypothetical protein [Trapelia coarctata]